MTTHAVSQFQCKFLPKKNIFHFVHIVTPRNKESFCKMFVYILAYLINLLRLQFFLATYVDDEEKRKRKRKIMERKKVIIKLVKIFFLNEYHFHTMLMNFGNFFTLSLFHSSLSQNILINRPSVFKLFSSLCYYWMVR